MRALAVVLALVAGGALPVAGPAAPACAGAEGPRAGLVVDTGARVQTFCVQLDAAQVTGLHLIELAAQQHHLSYGFGLGGAAVCRLAGVGPQGSDCFADYPSFWGYWHGSAGGWFWASTGAGSHRLGDGDLDGWVWGEGDTPTTHEQPPASTIHDICPELAPEPPPTRSTTPAPTDPGTPSPRASAGGGGQTDEGAGSTTGGGSPTSTERPSRTDVPGRSTGPTPTSSDGTPSLQAAGAPQTGGGGGPPAGLFVAGAFCLALVVGGVLRFRAKGDTG